MRRGRVAIGVGLAIVAAMAIAVAIFRPGRLARVGAGMAAHTLCSQTFVAGRDPRTTFDAVVAPMLGRPVASLYRYRIDADARRVDASFIGVFRATARFTPGFGCRLDHPGNGPLAAVETAPRVAPADTAFATAAPVVAADPAIRAALDRVFAEDPSQPVKDVQAVVVVRHGRVVAERYAAGVGPTTPLMSWSVAKSFTNALVGILVRQGRLRVDQPVGAPEWPASDPRARITVEDLMRMRSGLDAEESSDGSDPVSRMEFLEPDMAAFVATRPAKAPPGRTFEYTSANTIVVDRLVGHLVGNGAAGLRDFATRELFAPLGLSDATMEFDGAGTFFGSTYLFATARDYARFGELYLHDGVTPEGRRILPEGWVAWSRRATLDSGYGAGFFTNDGPSRVAAQRVAAGFPRDGYFASGVLGQRIYIVPSADLVIVRFGHSRPPDFGIEDDLALIDAAVRAGR